MATTLNPADPLPSEFTEIDLETLVHRFYAKVRRDPLIGPVFNGAIVDWDAHLDKLANFWITVMLGVRRYKGNPLAAHLTQALTPEMFTRWVALWSETVPEVFAAPASDKLIAKAHQMSRTMQFAMFERDDKSDVSNKGERSAIIPPDENAVESRLLVPSPFAQAPHFITQVFDEDTLPEKLREEHHLKPGTWGLIRVLEGVVRYNVIDPPSQTILTPEHPGIVWPGQPHYVTPLGHVKMQIEFHTTPPRVSGHI